MIVNGKQIAESIKSELITKVSSMQEAPALHIFVVGENPVIESFVKYKRFFADTIKVKFIEHRFDTDISEDELIAEIKQVSQGSPGSQGSVGIVVQLPLPIHLNTQRVLDAVPSELDIDGLTTESKHLAPVAGAVREILEREDISVEGKEALVVGKGKLVGKPVANLLANLGVKVTVVDKTTEHSELAKLCKYSDIIVSGAGVPNLITEDMIKNGVILLDAGTSTQNNSVVGDIDINCQEQASYFAKTPGGIGPITIAVLFKNLVGGAVMTK